MIFLGGETYSRWKRISRLFSLKMKIFTWVKQYTRPGIGRIKIYRQNNVFQAHKCLPVFNCVPEVETVVVDSRKERRPMWRPETVRGHHPRYVKQQQQQHSNRHAYKQRYSRNISTAGIKSINEWIFRRIDSPPSAEPGRRIRIAGPWPAQPKSSGDVLASHVQRLEFVAGIGRDGVARRPKQIVRQRSVGRIFETGRREPDRLRRFLFSIKNRLHFVF